MKRSLVLLFILAACTSTTSKVPPAPAPTSVPVAKTGEPEAISLLGKPLVSAPAAADVQQKREEDLAKARADYNADPDSADAIIWLGRRTAYLGRYRDAIDIFSEGIRKHPDDARMYRHRGHRYITVRRFADAVKDLQNAARLTRGKKDQVEPDGQPNARNIPIGSLQSNIYYHLGLAHYLRGNFAAALQAYEHGRRLSGNPDRLVSNSYWHYLTLRRLGRADDAEKVLEGISPSMDVIENISYHKLLLVFSGDISPEELLRQDSATIDGATMLYGLGSWYFVNGDQEKAYALWQRLVDSPQWPSFGYIAAEAEIAGRGKR